MNLKAFLGDALSRALDLEIATADDVLRHLTPDVLASSLPRPLWSRLLTACLGAPKVDSQLVIETVGIPNLCEHVPMPILWACISEIAQRALGLPVPMGTPRSVPLPGVPAALTTPKSGPIPRPQQTPPRPIPAVAPAAAAPQKDATLSDVFDALDDESPKPRPTPIAGQRFRQAQTNAGARAAVPAARRPQAAAPVAAPAPATRIPRRGVAEISELETETEFRDGEPIAVDDSQLVDWQSAEETQTSGGGGGDRKR